MKKVLSIFTLSLLLTGGSFAFMNEHNTSDPALIEAQGFSRSTVELVDLVNYRNKAEAINNRYVRRFSPKQHRNLGKGYSTLKKYFDPIQDDGLFGDHQIEYSNSWMGDNTRYTSDTDSIENL